MLRALAAVLAGSLAACGNGGGGGNPEEAAAAVDPGDSGSFTLLVQSAGDDQEDPFDLLIDAFQTKYPDIEVEVQKVPIGGAFADTLRSRLRGGNAPDVFYATPGSGGLASVLPLAGAGYAADLTGHSWATESVPENAEYLYYQDDKLWAVPIDQVTIAQVYNMGALEQVGIDPPTTMPELLAACPVASADGVSMLALAGANPQNAGLLASALAANYVLSVNPEWNTQRREGGVSFAGSPEWQQTLQAIIDLNEAGCFPDGVEAADIPQVAPQFANGEAVSWVFPTGSIGAVKGVNPDAVVVAYPLPGETEQATGIYASPSDALVLSVSGADNPAAVRLLEFVVADEGSGIYAEAGGNLSLQEASDIATAARDKPELAGITPLMSDDARVHPLIQLDWEGASVYEALGKGVQGLLTGQQSVEDVLTEMDHAWDQ